MTVAPARVDLHAHSCASDGADTPTGLVERAAAAGLHAIALTDHDTTAGVDEAMDAGQRLGVRVVAGCEFSVAVSWGEMHLLGYFLPADAPALAGFLAAAREDRARRVRAMVEQLNRLGIAITEADVLAAADGGALGRPHVARALVRRGAVRSVNEAFDRFLGRGRAAFVAKTLPAFREVAELVHSLGGIVSAAHLKERATRTLLQTLRAGGLDAVEVCHPSHDPDLRRRIAQHAGALGLLATGGSDWHGEPMDEHGHGALGSEDVPASWLDALELAASRRKQRAGVA